MAFSMKTKRSRPPSRAGNGRTLRIAKLTERMPIKLIKERMPDLATSVVTAKIPTVQKVVINGSRFMKMILLSEAGIHRRKILQDLRKLIFFRLIPKLEKNSDAEVLDPLLQK